MDLDEIRALLAVAEFGSFVNAARATSMTRSTLRRRVDELEIRVGTTLIERSARGAILTSAGEMVAREGRHIIEHSRALLQAARVSEGDNSRSLNVVLQQGLPTELVAMALELMTGRFPELRIVVDFSPNPLASLVDDADLVVAVWADPPDGPWRGIRLRSMQERLLASPTYLTKMGHPQSLPDLERHRLAAWHSPRSRSCFLHLRNGGVFPVVPVVSTSDIHLLHTLAGNGQNLVYAPDAMISDALGAHPLVEVMPDVVGRETFATLFVPQNLETSPRVRAILEVAERIAENELKSSATR